MLVTAVLITKEKEYPKDIVLDGFDEVIIKTESPSVYQRYVEAEKARNDIVYVQDDDAIVDYRELWKHYNGQLTNGITMHHTAYYQGTGITLIGWGCFFPKKMLENMKKYTDRWGVDNLLLREADRVFTYLNQPHNSIVMDHKDLPQVGRMSLERNHYESMQMMRNKLNLIKL